MKTSHKLNWSDLIARRNIWIAYNFPNTPSPGGSIMGMVEEVGELFHAELKMEQGIRGTDEEHLEAAKDAVGDITIYALGVMKYFEFKPHKVGSTAATPTRRSIKYHLYQVAYRTGGIAGWEAKQQTSYTPQTSMDFLLYHLEAYCMDRGWDYAEIVNTTWDAVEKRDWITYPKDGLTA